MMRSNPVVRWLRSLPLVAIALLLDLAPSPVQAGPARPDPKQMSGIPRPDPQIPAGEVTVRVLRGGFDDPVLGAKVELELRSADGRRADLRTEEAGNQGRAHFRDLGPFLGGQAVARVTVDDETLRSQQIDLLPSSGTAVMLVSGAPERRVASQSISLPGVVFDYDKTPPGTLMVGVFDLEQREGLADVDIELLMSTPEGEAVVQTKKTEERGQATFEGLAELPVDAVLQIRAQLDEEGAPHESMKFTVDPSKGRALVLARGRMSRAGTSPHEGADADADAGVGAGAGADPHAGAALQPLPPPQVSEGMPPGDVQVLVVDGHDQPVAEHQITIVKKDFAGTEERFRVTTNDRGIARRSGLPVVNDALYYVAVKYDGGPYTSSFFGLDKRGGVTVAMRVWPVTDDPKVARSAIQFEVIEGENDAAQVIQIYEVLVGGDEAYWPGAEPLRIVGIEGAKGMVVLRGAEEFLDHDEKAPFATLAHPIPPGEVAPLSIGYIIDGHDGELEIDWIPPFRVIESAIVLSDRLELDAPGAEAADREVPERPGLDYKRVAFDLGQQGTGPIRVVVRGLRQTDKRYRWIAIGVGGVLLLVVALGMALAPARDPRARLLRRRDHLLEALETPRDEAQRRRMVAALDRIYRQLDALESIPGRRPRVRSAG